MKLKYETRTYGKKNTGTAGWTGFSTSAQTRGGVERAMLKQAKGAYARHLSLIERGFIERSGIWEYHSYAPANRGALRYYVWVPDGAPFDAATIASWQPSDGTRSWQELIRTADQLRQAASCGAISSAPDPSAA